MDVVGWTDGRNALGHLFQPMRLLQSIYICKPRVFLGNKEDKMPYFYSKDKPKSIPK